MKLLCKKSRFNRLLIFLIIFIISSSTNVYAASEVTMVKNINEIPDLDITYLTKVGDLLYFKANNGVNGAELWKSDGTEAGTVMVKDINPGAGTSDSSYFTSINEELFFTANDGVNGFELWKLIDLYNLSYQPGSNGTITGSSSQSIVQGADGTAVTAVADSGYRFLNWSDGSVANPRIDSNVAANLSVTANFEAISPVSMGTSIPVSPVAVGDGKSNFNIPFGGTNNIGLIETSGANVLSYLNSVIDFSTTLSQSHSADKHKLKIIDLDLFNNFVTVQIESEPQIFKIKLSDQVSVDLDKDNKPDITVKFAD